MISYQQELAPPHSQGLTERLDRLLGSLHEECNGASYSTRPPFSHGLDDSQMVSGSGDLDDYFQSSPPVLDPSDTVRAITHSPTPQLPTEGVDLGNETVVGVPIIPEAVSAGEFLTGMEDQNTEIQNPQDLYNPVAFATPFAAVPHYPFIDAEELLNFNDRSISEEYWKKFISTTSTHES